ncbi:MAG: SDR family NAD(P)-dependent oxidoreductase [Allosphingosinicella sp.]|uniref:SDR family NAD(P)-dependent oxidoreductase n=1 Tax=Allosphingosinicella sp. TaxID=2823234 RepID=UPI0039449B1F
MNQLNKRIIVTGGASGIGASAVRAFVTAGARVTSIDLSGEGEKVAAEAAGPGEVRFIRASVADRTAMFAAVQGAIGWMGGLDGLVHVAGVQQYKPAEELTDEDWDRVLGVNARGTMIANQAVFAHLKANGGGRILNFASGAGMTGLRGCAHYAASKGAVLAWTRTIAQEWGRWNIAANCVAPGMWTPMYQQTRDGKSPDELAMHDAGMAMMIPLGGKLGDPDSDLAPMLVFLMSEGARFVTGQTLAVDGGLTMVR